MVSPNVASVAQDQLIPRGTVPETALEPRDTELDQAKLVGMLFPTFGGDDATDQLTTFLFKEQVRLRLSSRDLQRALGFSQSYQMGAPLANASHGGAVQLARQSGFQGVVWGAVAEYQYQDTFIGTAVFPNFSWAGMYDDFRTLPGQTDQRLENWIIESEGQTASVSPPSDFVPLPPYLVSEALRSSLRSGELCAQPSSGGACVPLRELEPNKAIAIDDETGRVVYQAFDGMTKYSADLPYELFADQSAVAYVAMFFNYARGHWSNTIRFAKEVEKADTSTSQMVHDALLYHAAALFRSGSDGSGPLTSAREAFPFSPAVSQYTVMAALLRLKAGQITADDLEEVVSIERTAMGDGWLRENGFSYDP